MKQEISEIINPLLPVEYTEWRQDIEQLIELSKLRTMMTINTNTLTLYWNIGKQIIEKQQGLGWGNHVITQLSKDLAKRFPDDRGYSERNLGYMKQFAQEYPDFPILQVPLAKLQTLPILQVALVSGPSGGQHLPND